ncbi:MAG: NifU family protein [Proteobacteria bacterium]|nr:NifU family protein [Pseudomonadota bacterium]
MFIQTEQTPNPASLKFLPGCEVMIRGTAEFRSPSEAHTSPLAERLFKIPGITGVFLGGNFVTATKSASADWTALKPLVLGALMEHFTTGQKVMLNEDMGHGGHSSAAADDDEIVKQIKELLDTRIRPVVAQDGGDIVFSSFDHGVVYLHMRGACAGCPSSTATLKTGIENMLRHFIPEVEEVRAVN